MGSTVILVFPENKVKFDKFFSNKKLKMGEEIASIIK